VTDELMVAPRRVIRDCRAACVVPGKRPDVAMEQPLRGLAAMAALEAAALRGGIGVS
jgi:hypothetical protein